MEVKSYKVSKREEVVNLNALNGRLSNILILS
jgi:hypothetical protein